MAQRNFTDPESRIMPDGDNKGSFVQGYNTQIAAASQVIVAAEVTQETNDNKQLLPMIAQVVANLAQKPEKVSAATDYFSEANVTDASVKGVYLYVATGHDKHSGVVEASSDPPPADASPQEAMGWKSRTEAGRGAPCTRCAKPSSSRSSGRRTARFSPLQSARQAEHLTPHEMVVGWHASHAHFMHTSCTLHAQ